MKESRRKILFLDIDGVLNCHLSMSYWSPEHPRTYRIDEICWGNLQYVLDSDPDIEVVIHSGWIKTKDNPEATWDMGTGDPNIFVKSLLPEVVERLGPRFIGYVPYIKGGNKFHRILTWLCDNGFDPIHMEEENVTIVVVDDENTMRTNLRQLRNFNICVRFTDPQFGLEKNDAEYIKSVFAGKEGGLR